MSYVPILFPTISYGPTGDVLVVASAIAAAALPPVYTATPVAPAVPVPVSALPPAPEFTTVILPNGAVTLPTPAAQTVNLRLGRIQKVLRGQANS